MVVFGNLSMPFGKTNLPNLRLIARLDVKGSDLIKGIHLEGLRKIGVPNDYALDYYKQGIDELIYMDCVASLYGRNHLRQIIEVAVKNIFIPITVGGGIRSVDDVTSILRSGADKVAVNTAAVKSPALITEIAKKFGSQCMVSSIEAKKIGVGQWEVYVDNGRERTGIDVVTWAKECVSNGAGEILLTSIDNEGTHKGFDNELIAAVSSEISVPLIASGGMGKPNDLVQAKNNGADAIAMADILHYKKFTVAQVRKEALENQFTIRKLIN
jgi:cyclase